MPRSNDIISCVRVSPTDDAELRASMKKLGWLEHLPGIKDESGRTLVGNRRERLARDLDIAPNFITVSGLDEEARVRLAAASNVGGAKMTRKDRKHLAKALYTQLSWTQERIAEVLGVSQQTISDDLSDITRTGNVPRIDTRGRRASSGRPRRQAAPRRHAQAEQIVSLSDGRPRRRIAEETNTSERTVRREQETQLIEQAAVERARAEGLIDPSTLGMNARQRLETAIHQATRKLEREHELKVEADVRKRIEEAVIPYWLAKEAEYNQVIRSRRGLFSTSMFRKMKAALHEDLVQGEHNKQRARECFNFMNENEVALVGEAGRPTQGTSLPRTWADWENARARATEERRAARAARQNGSPSRR